MRMSFCEERVLETEWIEAGGRVILERTRGREEREFDKRKSAFLISILPFKRMFSIYATLNLLDNSWGILLKFQP